MFWKTIYQTSLSASGHDCASRQSRLCVPSFVVCFASENLSTLSNLPHETNWKTSQTVTHSWTIQCLNSKINTGKNTTTVWTPMTAWMSFSMLLTRYPRQQSRGAGSIMNPHRWSMKRFVAERMIKLLVEGCAHERAEWNANRRATKAQREKRRWFSLFKKQLQLDIEKYAEEKKGWALWRKYPAGHFELLKALNNKLVWCEPRRSFNVKIVSLNIFFTCRRFYKQASIFKVQHYSYKAMRCKLFMLIGSTQSRD